MKKDQLTPPLKWHGGKHYLAAKIIELMPPHMHYVEPYAGGLSVLLQKECEGVSEVVNDLNGELTNFWMVLRDTPDRMLRALWGTPFCESDFVAAKNFASSDNVRNATAFFIRCRQSLAGRMQEFATLSRTRTRRGMNEQASAYLTAIEGLPAVHERLKRVVILNRDALEVIRQQDGKDTLFYLDPPYLHETRTTTGEYEHEMNEEDHRKLLVALTTVQGKFLLSGYNSSLYDSFAETHHWNRYEFELPNNAAGGKSKRRMVECVWTNF